MPANRQFSQVPRARIYHLGAKVNQHGGVKALCFQADRAINLSRATWTNRPEAVTCPKCHNIMASAEDKTHAR